MDIKTRVSFDHEDKYGCISILKQSYIESNGQMLSNERRAFTPTQIDEVKEYAPSLVSTCETIWTPEVIERWEKEEQAWLQPEIEPEEPSELELRLEIVEEMLVEIMMGDDE